MLLPTLPKRKITFIYRNRNKTSNKNPQTDRAKNNVEKKQLQLQTKEKELDTREYKLQEKSRKFDESVQKAQKTQQEIERKIKKAKKELEYLIDETNNFNATEKVKFNNTRRNSFVPFRLLPYENPRRSREYERKRKHGTLMTNEWYYSTIRPGDTYHVWRNRYKSKRMPLRNRVTAKQILLYSSVAVVCSPCLFVLILSSCFWCCTLFD